VFFLLPLGEIKMYISGQAARFPTFQPLMSHEFTNIRSRFFSSPGHHV